MSKLSNIIIFICAIFNIIKAQEIQKDSIVNKNINKNNILFNRTEGHIIPEDSLNEGIKYFSWGQNILFNYMMTDNDEKYLGKAIIYFDKAIEKGNGNTLVYAERGSCKYFLKDYINAISDITIALDLHSKDDDSTLIFLEEKETYDKTDSGYIFKDKSGEAVWINVAHILKYRGACKMFLDDFRGAIDDFGLISKVPIEIDNQYYSYRGYCKYKLEKYNDAILDFNDAILKDYKDGQSYFFRGFCFINLNLKESACKDWSKAGELGFKQAYVAIQKNCQ